MEAVTEISPQQWAHSSGTIVECQNNSCGSSDCECAEQPHLRSFTRSFTADGGSHLTDANGGIRDRFSGNRSVQTAVPKRGSSGLPFPSVSPKLPPCGKRVSVAESPRCVLHFCRRQWLRSLTRRQVGSREYRGEPKGEN